MAQSGVGVVFKRRNGEINYEALADVKSITGPTSTRETIDTSSFDTAGGYRTSVAGLRDSGEISFSMNLTKTGYLLMKSDFESLDDNYYQIIIPATASSDGMSLDFAGQVTGIPMNIPLDDVISVDITIKISGMVNTWLPYAARLTGAATAATTATVTGTVGDNGYNTTSAVIYSASPSELLDETQTCTPAVNAGDGDTTVTGLLTGLTAGTTYFYAIEASNLNGTTRSKVFTFETPAS